MEFVTAYSIAGAIFTLISNGGRSRLVRFDPSDPSSAVILDDVAEEALGYWGCETCHAIQLSGRSLRVLRSGAVEVVSFVDWEKSLMYLTGSPEGAPIVYGDDGVALILRDGAFQKLETGLSENLRSLDIHPTSDVWAAAGNFGDFALGSSDGLKAIATGKTMTFMKAHVRDDGSVALALVDDNACEWRNGEIRDFERHGCQWKSITTFQGTEFWGDSDSGVFVRDGASFKLVFDTESAEDMHASDSHLVVNTFEFLHVFDGNSWRSFEAKGGKKRPIVEADYDIESSWP